MKDELSERALILAPSGRDAPVASEILNEGGMRSSTCDDLAALVQCLDEGAGFAVVTEEALTRVDLHPLSMWIRKQAEWSDLPFVLLTRRGGGLERNPEATRLLEVLGNVAFLERPFHPTTLISLARSALRGRRRQYEARARLVSLQESEERLKTANETLEARVEERTSEIKQALAQLHEVQKLETLGQLTGGVAHDFNNLLTPIIGNLDVLRRTTAGSEARPRRLIDSALQAAGRAATLVQRLLAFARRQDLQPQSVSIADLLDGMADMLTRSLGPTIEVQIQTDPDVPPARVDPNQLELAILNLAVNARDAMPDGGPLRIEVSTAHVENSGRIQPGRYVRIAVTDSGIGMDAETLSRAVEPFYSTKGLGKGTGLGLSMVHGLAAQLGGMLELQSAPGKGTTAQVWLPVSEDSATASGTEQEPLKIAVRHATILLVDDEELVRNGTADMLRDVGYDVISAASGPEALALLRGGTDIHLVITDYLMPGMDGVDLAQEIRAIAGDIPVLLITGYSTIASGPGASLPRLAKPFRQVELAARVSDLLTRARSAQVVPLRPKAHSSGSWPGPYAKGPQ